MRRIIRTGERTRQRRPEARDDSFPKQAREENFQLSIDDKKSCATGFAATRALTSRINIQARMRLARIVRRMYNAAQKALSLRLKEDSFRKAFALERVKITGVH